MAGQPSDFMGGFMQSGAGSAMPWGAAIQGATQLGMKALEPVATNSHVSGSYEFDTGGGFTLNIGSGKAEQTANRSRTSLPSAGQAVQAAAAGVGSLLSSPAFVVLVGLGLYLYLKHK